MHITDQQLLALIAAGDRAAFGELFDRFAPRLFGLLLKIVSDRAEAEDVLQEVFLQVWRNAARYDARLSQPIVWLMLIARAKGIDAVRRRASHNDLLDRAPRPPEFASGRAGARADALEQAPRLSGALAALPAEQSDAIGLAFQGGLAAAQIAALRGVPVGTVKTRIRSGMIKLRDAVNSRARAFQSSEVAT